jgi:hypothetical protein
MTWKLKSVVVKTSSCDTLCQLVIYLSVFSTAIFVLFVFKVWIFYSKIWNPICHHCHTPNPKPRCIVHLILVTETSLCSNTKFISLFRLHVWICAPGQCIHLSTLEKKLHYLIIFNYYRKYNHHRKEVYAHVMPHK